MSQSAILSRRSFLKGGVLGAGLALAGSGILAPGLARAEAAPKGLKKIKIVWGQTIVCHAPISVAQERGFFEKNGLEVERINFNQSTDMLLQAIATGSADAGIGMALRWLKPLEQGFDVKLAVGTHGGCMRLLTKKDSPYKSIKDLVGKAVAVTDQASPIRNFFAIELAHAGYDPDRDISWVQYPADMFGEALEKGEVQAVAGDDPLMWLLKKEKDLAEIGNNLSGDYARLSCCVLGVSGRLVRDEPETAAAIGRSIIEAQHWTAAHPAEAAKIFAPYAPSTVRPEHVQAMLGEHTHAHAATGAALRGEIARFVDDLKLINVIRKSTDSQRFAEHVAPDVKGL